MTVKTEKTKMRPPLAESDAIDGIARSSSTSTTTKATPSRTLTEEIERKKKKKKKKKEERKKHKRRLQPGGTADMPLVIDDD